MLTTVRHIFGRIMHSETALHSQWDKGRKNNLLFASPSICRPTCRLFDRGRFFRTNEPGKLRRMLRIPFGQFYLVFSQFISHQNRLSHRRPRKNNFQSQAGYNG